MKFHRSRELKLFNATWDRIIHSSARPGELQSIKLCGPRGGGKTFFVQELARTQRGIYYMSFAGMSAEDALRKFVKLYLPEDASVTNWTEAAEAFTALRHHRRTLLVFEDEAEEWQQECKKGCKTTFHHLQSSHPHIVKRSISHQLPSWQLIRHLHRHIRHLQSHPSVTPRLKPGACSSVLQR